MKILFFARVRPARNILVGLVGSGSLQDQNL